MREKIYKNQKDYRFAPGLSKLKKKNWLKRLATSFVDKTAKKVVVDFFIISLPCKKLK